ncbi:MAG: ATP-binding cassette domain-containing protein [Nitrospiraceae bacterium]|nr:ATP-binding cassette domain-containing protein [Nitrospiraceae bacterium]
MAEPPPLETLGLCKQYPGVRALKDVSISFRAGEVHALIGKNGAGKSTLVKILTGAVQPASGTVAMAGVPVAFPSPRAALRRGIAAVHQELSLVPELTVAENVFLGHPPTKWAGLAVDAQKTTHMAADLLAEMGLHLSVTRKARELGVAEQQVVEIAKAMSRHPKALLLDEPTSALAREEVDGLFALIRRLAGQGVVILYITHRLQELQQIADRISVLRNGELAAQFTGDEASAERIAQAMFGEFMPVRVGPPETVTDEVILETRNLQTETGVRDASLTLRRGEILGIAGLLGSGRTELLRAIAGVDFVSGGDITVAGRVIKRVSLATMRKAGVVLVPEDRQAEGLVPALSVGDNICLASLRSNACGGVILRKRRAEAIARSVRELAIGTTDVDAPVSSLSGGNQQKVVIAGRLNARPQVVLFDEPTRGIDVQAKQQIFDILRHLSREGIGSALVSSELEELLEVCHRIAIMRGGRIEDEVIPAGTSPRALLERCMRIEKAAPLGKDTVNELA